MILFLLLSKQIDHNYNENNQTDTSTISPTKRMLLLLLQLYNTRQKETFEKKCFSKGNDGYMWADRVYDYEHIGNFRAFVRYDLLKRTRILLYIG